MDFNVGIIYGALNLNKITTKITITITSKFREKCFEFKLLSHRPSSECLKN